MKKNFGMFFISIYFVLANTLVYAADNTKVAVMVNGVPINVVEVEQEVLTVLPMNQNFHGKMPQNKMDELRKEALQRLIDLELKYQDAQAKKIELDANVREIAIKKITDRFKNKSELNAAIKEAGFTRESFEHFVERPLYAALIVKKEVDDKIATTDIMVKQYYESNKAHYNKPKEFRASHIMFKIDPSLSNEDKAKIKTRAEGVLKKLKEGADFGEVASKESDDMSFIKGGDLGYFHAGQMMEELEKPLDSMKAGEMSGLIESLYGLHIVKLTDMKPSRQILFDEIKDKIKKDLIGSEKKRLNDEWFSSLTKKAVISYPVAHK